MKANIQTASTLLCSLEVQTTKFSIRVPAQKKLYIFQCTGQTRSSYHSEVLKQQPWGPSGSLLGILTSILVKHSL